MVGFGSGGSRGQRIGHFSVLSSSEQGMRDWTNQALGLHGGQWLGRGSKKRSSLGSRLRRSRCSRDNVFSRGGTTAGLPKFDIFGDSHVAFIRVEQ